MKVIIEDCVTGKFIFSPCSWTDKEEEALDFESPDRAKAFCCEHCLSDARIIVRHAGAVDVFPGTAVPESNSSLDWRNADIAHR